MKVLKIILSFLIVIIVISLATTIMKRHNENNKYTNLYGFDNYDENRIAYIIDKEIGLTDDEIQVKSSLTRMIAQYNSECPIDFDEQKLTRVSGSFFPNNFSLTYYFLLKNMNHDDIDWIDLHTTQSERILKLYNTSEDFKTFREGNVSLHYFYHDQNEKIGAIIAIP